MDLKIYGPFNPGDMTTLPGENGRALVNAGAARDIELGDRSQREKVRMILDYVRENNGKVTRTNVMANYGLEVDEANKIIERCLEDGLLVEDRIKGVLKVR